MNLIQLLELGEHEKARMLMVKEYKKIRNALRIKKLTYIPVYMIGYQFLKKYANMRYNQTQVAINIT